MKIKKPRPPRILIDYLVVKDTWIINTLKGNSVSTTEYIDLDTGGK